MDTWMVAVAAGAGYIAQHWKDLKRGGQIISEPSPKSSNSGKPDFPRLPQGKICPLHRTAKGETLGKDFSEEKEKVSQGVAKSGIASTSDFNGENLVTLTNYEDNDVFSTSSLLPGLIGSDGLQGDQEGVGVSESIDDILVKPSTAEISSPYGPAKNRSVLRSRQTNGRFIKPLTSLESCVLAHVYKDHVEMEEYILSSISSPSTQSVRPFFVTDGSKAISWASGDSCIARNRIVEKQQHKETYSEHSGAVCGVPPLPNIGSMEIRRKPKVKSGRERGGKLTYSTKKASGKHSNSLEGSSHGTLLLCLGISFGIISSFLTSRREVDKLNQLLKQTENLVQDLQEELEMKDSVTMKELAVEDYGSKDLHKDSFSDGAPHSFSHEHQLDGSTKDDDKKFPNQKTENESLSKIEAELEAELEMLELNMSSASLEGKLSNLVELDPDFAPDIGHGDLRADMFGRQAGDQPYVDRDGSGSGSSTTHSANYAVSPRELSLRLYEVLQSRLEERIKELETAIEKNSQKNTDQERRKRWRDVSSSEAGGSSSIQGSPVGKEQNLGDEPVVLNLSGEALDACNEAYDEFAKIDESEEEDLHLEVGNINIRKSLDQFDLNACRIQNGSRNDYMPLHLVNNGSPDHHHRREEDVISQDDIGTSGDENFHNDEEMEKLLIKHIIEKTRKGSPVVLNAQRVLFSMDENAL